jgi:putative flippase GtrA
MIPQPPQPSRAGRLARRFGGYVLTGGTAAVVDLGLFVVILPFLGSVPVAAGASFSIAAVVNYALTSLLVFRERLTLGRGLRFFASAAVGFAVNVAVTWTCARGLHMPPPLAKLCGIGVAFLLNFALVATVVFRAPRTAPAAAPGTLD